MSQSGVIGIHGELLTVLLVTVLHPVAQLLEEVIETFTGSPPDRVLRVLVLPDQNAVSPHDPVGREIDKVAYPRIDDAPSNQPWPFAVVRCDPPAMRSPTVPAIYPGSIS
jgi:hypothetical protein